MRSTQIKILYADDEVRYHKLVKMFLQEFSYDIETFSNGSDLLNYLSVNPKVDLILLDVMMPELNGWETCKYIEEHFNIPVIMITALGDESSEENGLMLGADDYISKPFSKKILSARVHSILRRTKNEINSILNMEGINFNEHLFFVSIDANNIFLTQKEYYLFKYLVINKKIVLNRESILDKVWGMDYCGDPRTVDTHIKSLRSKLQLYRESIKTVRGSGYTFIGVKS
jgi:two-component system, OmpR family, response regulator ResD